MKHCQHLKWNITPRHLKSSSCCPFPPFSGSSLKTNRLFSLGVNRTTPYKMKVGRLNGPAVKPRQKGVWNACQKRIQVTSGGLSRSARTAFRLRRLCQRGAHTSAEPTCPRRPRSLGNHHHRHREFACHWQEKKFHYTFIAWEKDFKGIFF